MPKIGNRDLGALAAPLDFFESKVTYQNDSDSAAYEVSRHPSYPDGRFLQLETSIPRGREFSRKIETVEWQDCSPSVREAMKRKFRMRSPSPEPTAAAGQAFSGSIGRSIRRIVNGLTPWDRSTAHAQIETKLRSVPENEQQILLMHLNTELSGKVSDAKPAIIRNWAATGSVAAAMAGRDLRTDRERERQDALATQKANPAFWEPCVEISDMLPWAERNRILDISLERYGDFHSILFRRVFRDSRGPVAAVNDIRNLIAPLPEHQRNQAILDWVPQSQADE